MTFAYFEGHSLNASSSLKHLVGFSALSWILMLHIHFHTMRNVTDYTNNAISVCWCILLILSVRFVDWGNTVWMICTYNISKCNMYIWHSVHVNMQKSTPWPKLVCDILKYLEAILIGFQCGIMNVCTDELQPTELGVLCNPQWMNRLVVSRMLEVLEISLEFQFVKTIAIHWVNFLHIAGLEEF